MTDPVPGFINRKFMEVPGHVCISNTIPAFLLKPFVNFCSIRRGDGNFRHEHVPHVVVSKIKLIDGTVVIGFLSAEIIAGKTNDAEVRTAIKRIESPEISQLTRVTTKGCRIYNKHFLAC